MRQAAQTRVNYTFGYLCINTLPGSRTEGSRTQGSGRRTRDSGSGGAGSGVGLTQTDSGQLAIRLMFLGFRG